MLPSWNRREMLRSASAGFGWMALNGLIAEQARAAAPSESAPSESAPSESAPSESAPSAPADLDPLAPRAGHHAARAKRVIFVFMHGGPSQVDTFDYKPTLAKFDGKDLPFEPAKGTNVSRKVLQSPWKFAQHGECGAHVSELFPEVARYVDDLCILKGMHTEGQSHGQAVLKLHTGNLAQARPSIGAWVTYGLGSQNRDLPGFVTICPTRSHGGVLNYGTAFLPAVYQGTPIGHAGTPAGSATIRHIANDRLTAGQQRQQLDLLQALNRDHAERVRALEHTGDDRLEAVINGFELAFRMQSAVPKLTDLGGESPATLQMYGIGNKVTDDFGRQCLMARRFAEAGVRFIQVSHSFKWDQHGNLKQHAKNALEVDKPIAGLLADLKARDLLKDTLVLWGGEFGRTPVAQGKDGRDHNPQGFTMWLAGGGVKSGFSYGETDEFGYHAVREKVHMHDLHATILDLLGLNHEKLTYRYAGRDFRLTDVYGRVVKEIYA